MRVHDRQGDVSLGCDRKALSGMVLIH